jgi:phosphopantetheinyl transferase (holo-ACP synthase)
MIRFAVMDIMHQFNIDHLVAGIGLHKGVDAKFDEAVFEREREILTTLSPRKKSEWLATRELLFRIGKFPERIECIYDDFGKPFLKDSDKHISVSHSGSWAAAAISDMPCGIDIQEYSKTVERIREKFVTNEELGRTEMLKNRLHHLHVIWGAKECMYKAYGKRKLEFREHIAVTELNIANCSGKGMISYEGLHLPYEIHFRILPEAALVFCYQHPRHLYA